MKLIIFLSIFSQYFLNWETVSRTVFHNRVENNPANFSRAETGIFTTPRWKTLSIYFMGKWIFCCTQLTNRLAPNAFTTTSCAGKNIHQMPARQSMQQNTHIIFFLLERIYLFILYFFFSFFVLFALYISRICDLSEL